MNGATTLRFDLGLDLAGIGGKAGCVNIGRPLDISKGAGIGKATRGSELTILALIGNAVAIVVQPGRLGRMGFLHGPARLGKAAVEA